MPNGHYLSVSLPEAYKSYHFGPKLRTFILQQYYQARVTRPKLLEQLHSWGIEISVGELNHILSVCIPSLEKELTAAFKTALSCSSYIQTDDTGARHAGKNHVCTHIGNHLFTYQVTGTSKSRLHFLEMLNQDKCYSSNEFCLNYLKQHGSLRLIDKANQHLGKKFTQENIGAFLTDDDLGKNQKRTLEEALSIGFLTEQLGEKFVVLSDGAPQYAVLQHAGCWVHALRLLEKECPLRKGKTEEILARLRHLYHHLKRYKKSPRPLFKKRLDIYFDLICDLRSGNESFDRALKRFFLNKQDLLRSLESPEIPLHNNLSENDLREYVVRRKLSGGTRSDLGRRCRDVFCSLVKTCMKLRVNFWSFLEARIKKEPSPSLSDFIKKYSSSPTLKRSAIASA
jgi:Transposase IS66 family